LHATEFVTLLPFVGFFLILQLLWLWQTQFGGCFAVATAKAQDPHASLAFLRLPSLLRYCSAIMAVKKDMAWHHLPVMPCLTEKNNA